jgi:hypothetical protein
LGRLENQLDTILKEPLSSEERYARYEQTFRRIQQLRGMQLNPPPYLAPDAPLPVQQVIYQKLPTEVLSTLGRNHKKSGELLVKHIERNPVFKWDENMQLVVDGNPIKGSNMVDLVHDFTIQ